MSTSIYRQFKKGDRVKIDPTSRLFRSIAHNHRDRLGTVTSKSRSNYESYNVRWDGTKHPVTYYCYFLIKVETDVKQ